MAYLRVGAILFVFCISNVLGQNTLFGGPTQSTKCYNATTIQLIYVYNNHEELLPCPADQPFCDPEVVACVANNPEIKFKCPGDYGFYPDIWNPKKYYICVNRVSYEFQCSSENWNQKERKCGNSNTSNSNFNCTGKTVANGSHSTDKDLYATCHNGKAISINQCPTGYIFDEALNECDFKCDGKGVIKDLIYDRRYIVCSMEGKEIKKQIQTCLSGMRYDIKFGGCVEDKINKSQLR